MQESGICCPETLPGRVVEQNVGTKKNVEKTDPLIGTTIEGRYEIIDLIGRGGMGAVYRARQLLLDKILALKVVLPGKNESEQAILRFLQEGKAAMELTHENIITVRDFGQTNDGILYLAMDFVEGKNLKDIIKKEERLEVERIARISTQICDALHHAHSRGIVHRDIKPANILLANDPDGNEIVKLFDFGIAKLQFDDHKITKTGALVGTPTYMSPEQVSGSQPDARSDIYAVGCILFEMLTGKPPFRSDASMDTYLKHLNEPIPKIERNNVPEMMVSIVNKCLSKEPEDRYATTKELKVELEKLLRTEKVEVPIPPSRKGVPVFRVAMIATGIAIVMTIALRVNNNTAKVDNKRIEPATTANSSSRIPAQSSANSAEDAEDSVKQRQMITEWRHSYRLGQQDFNAGHFEAARKELLKALNLSHHLRSSIYETGTLAVLIDLCYVEKNRAQRREYMGVYREKLNSDLRNLELNRLILDTRTKLANDWIKAPTSPITLSEAKNRCSELDALAEERIIRGLLFQADEAVNVASQVEFAMRLPPEIQARTLSNRGEILERVLPAKAQKNLLSSIAQYKKANRQTEKVARTYLVLARSHIKLKQFDQAGENSAEAIKIHKSILGPSHLTVAVDLSMLGRSYLARNKRDEANRTFQEVISICKDQKLGTNVDDAETIAAYAIALRCTGKRPESLEVQERIKSIIEAAVWKDDYFRLAPIYQTMVEDLSAVGRNEEAFRLKNRHEAIIRRHRETVNPTTQLGATE